MIRVIAANTFLEALRDRIWVIAILFGVAVLAGQHALTPIALGEGPRVTVDLGLSTIGLLGLVVAIMVGGNMVHQEIDRRSIHMILARPLPRTKYIIGKWLGLCGMLWAMGLLMGMTLIMVAWNLRGTGAVLPVVQAVFLNCLSFSILCSLAVLFSSLSTPLLSSLYALGIYGLGWWAMDIRELATHISEPIRTALVAGSYLIPNLELFNGRYAVAHLEPIPEIQIVVALIYAAAYSAAILSLAVVAFQVREFK